MTTTSSPGSELRRLRALVSDLDAVVWEADAASGRFTFVSEGALDILGYPPRAFLDEPSFWADHIHPDDRDAVLEEFLAGTGAVRAHDLEYRFLHPDGTIAWVRDIGHTVTDSDGRPHVVRGLIVDVTRHKVAEERAALAGRTEDLERALEAEREEAAELRALDEMKNTFLAAVSHDLRTPLAAILGLAVTLEHHTLEEAESKDLASRIAANARRLDRMVADLLDLDRLSRGLVEPSLRSVDLGDLVTRTVHETELAAGRDVAIDVCELDMELDAAKIERIVENLIANAVRHTPPDAHIWVSVRPDDGGALIVVEDDGPGVPPEQRQVIFQPFRQAATPEHSPGVGIGLALVARFAELHGGRAWVQERDGGGASFRVWLPGQATASPTG
jgi:PAS domain S-box-containing protein